MRILYGVVGEGMGHATRSKVVLDELCRHDHEITIVVSGRAYNFMFRHFSGNPKVNIKEIQGLTLDYEHNKLDIAISVYKNIKTSFSGLVKNFKVYREIHSRRRFRPDVVISDFESWAYFYGALHRIPVISIDNMQIINRCEHSPDVTMNQSFFFKLAKQAVKMKLPFIYHYLITSFFFPKVRKPRSTLIPPILRKEIYAAVRERGEHVLIYQTGAVDENLVADLKTLPYQFRFYGRVGDTCVDDNIEYKAFSEKDFIDDLRTARAVFASAGNSLMCEAVHLGVPMLALPIEGQFEQKLNALYLKKLGYGDITHEITREIFESFLNRTPEFEEALKSYPRQTDNSILFNCLQNLLEDIANHHPPGNKLRVNAMGFYENQVN